MKNNKFFLFLIALISCLTLYSQQKPQVSWIKVEGGSFFMGCDEKEKDCYPDEMPRHKVTISSFEISKYEVTVKDYRTYCEATNKAMPLEPAWGWQDDNPIVNITWQDAMDYALWMNCSLPTEAQWEYAARGGNKSKGYTYSGSNNYDEVGWSYENSNKTSHPIGQKKPNELGIYDMSGNAWEWCSDNYEIFYYKDSPKVNPKGPQKGLGKVNRGGCFAFDYSLMNTHHRRCSSAEAIGSGTGMRLVRNIKR
jgi:sulfatase modifying factor 1